MVGLIVQSEPYIYATAPRRLEFPGLPTISITKEATGGAIVRLGHVKANPPLFKMHKQTVQLKAKTASLTKSNYRVSLISDGETIWTWRRAWKDAEMKRNASGVVFVPNPENWGDDLQWWLLAALIVNQRETLAVDWAEYGFFSSAIILGPPVS